MGWLSHRNRRTVWTGITLCAALLLVAVSQTDAGTKRSRLKRARARPASLSYSGPVSAVSAVVVDTRTGDVLYGKNPERIRPIASITKLMTALVFLDAHPDLSQRIPISTESLLLPGRKRFRAGEQVMLYDLLCSAIIASDNVAARMLALSTGSEQAFVERMNAKARLLGLSESHFADPTGLNPDNVSTAMDCARLVSIAARDDRISQIMRTEEYIFRTDRVFHRLHTTNRLLRTDLDIVGGKTGFIRQSGYCLTTIVRGQNHREVAATVLGSRSNSKRFADMKRILDEVLRKN